MRPFVKPFAKRQKNYVAYAEAIVEAALSPINRSAAHTPTFPALE
jgi:hypothetical protein